MLNCTDIQTKYAVKANWIGHSTNCLLKHVIEAKIEGSVEGDEGDVSRYWINLRKKIEYWKLKEETLDRTVWSCDFGGDCGRVVRQTTE